MYNENLPPLAVDLDGSLIKTDLLWESFVKFARIYPWRLFYVVIWMLHGKAQLKHKLAEAVDIDVTVLPYNQEVLEWLKNEHRNGRQIVLATASDKKYAYAVADYCNIFSTVMASDGKINLSKNNKADKLAAEFGEKKFDYVGNSADDLSVWRRARKAILVNTGHRLTNKAEQVCDVSAHFSRIGSKSLAILKALRLHQWVKNLLVFLPIIAAHQFFNPIVIGEGLLIFLLFGLAASSGYLLNDLLDIENDRHHHSKYKRPFASGELSIPVGLLLCVSLILMSLAGSWLMSPQVFYVVLLYYIATVSYSLTLKSKVIVDVLLLAGLYTTRIIAGSVATNIKLSFWLLVLSMFTFLCLAFIKRYAELEKLQARNQLNAKGRGYYVSDVAIIAASGVASGYISVLVLALYLNSEIVNTLYSRPELLWLTCPVYLYWISRMCLVTARGEMHDDPIVYALKDRNCLMSVVFFTIIMLLAI